MTELSPTAQAVLDAANNAYWLWDQMCPAGADVIAAAALRAAADQVVPVEAEIDPLKAWSIEDWNHMNATKNQREKTRLKLLVIATELENHQ